MGDEVKERKDINRKLMGKGKGRKGEKKRRGRPWR
jgi:hypothetical protein